MDQRPLVEGNIANFGISLDFFKFFGFGLFFPFKFFFGFCVFWVHPTVALVLLSISVERFDVSRMRDFFIGIEKGSALVNKPTVNSGPGGTDLLTPHEEQHRKWTAQLICSSFLYGTRLPLTQRGAKQRINIPFYSLYCSLLSQRQSCPIQK